MIKASMSGAIVVDIRLPAGFRLLLAANPTILILTAQQYRLASVDTASGLDSAVVEPCDAFCCNID